EQDARAAEHPVALAVVDRDEVPVDLGDTIGAARMERRRFTLRRLPRLAEHLARRRLVEANPPGIKQPDRLEDASDADGGILSGKHWLLPARRHEAHGGEVVDLVGAHGAEDIDEGELIEQVGLVQLDAALQMGDALEVLGARTANDAVDLIALVEEQFSQIAAVLARDDGDDRPWNVPGL